jgi:toxin ParE1/3/4
MAVYRLRPQAVSDLRSIRNFIAKDNPERAKTFLIELRLHFQRLADRHIQHRLVPELGSDLRLAVHGNYNIYYRFMGANGQDVLVVRVLHGARNIEDIDTV